MEKLTEKLRCVLEDCIDYISPIQQEVINKSVNRLAAYEDTRLEPKEVAKMATEWTKYETAMSYVDEIGINRLRELAQADREGRCVVLPVAIGTTVYHITTCKDFPKVLDGTLYDSSGGYGTATGYYCPCELTENCPFDAEDFDCDENGNKLNIFEDTVNGIDVNDCENCIRLYYSGTVEFEDIGKTVFLTREEAEAALEEMKNG